MGWVTIKGHHVLIGEASQAATAKKAKAGPPHHVDATKKGLGGISKHTTVRSEVSRIFGPGGRYDNSAARKQRGGLGQALHPFGGRNK